MLDSIYIGITGLQGYSNGLRAIANNTANINTPGFKSSSLQFSDLFYSQGNGGGAGGGQNYGQLGYGLNTGATTLNFKQGELRQTGKDLDLAVDGDGLFTLQDASGKIHYTRAGQFQFDAKGVLVNRDDGDFVMGWDAKGNLSKITLDGQKFISGAATKNCVFSGNLPAGTTQTVGNITVIDASGGSHQLSAQFVPGAGTSYTVTVMDGATTVGTGTVSFINGKPDPASAKVSFSYAPVGLGAIPLTLDFSNNVTSFASGAQLLLQMDTQDGYVPGSLSKMTFDDTGTLVLTYSNAQTAKGSKLALGRFDTIDAVGAVGGNQFDAIDTRAWHGGTANTGSFGAVHAGMVEISNVDLSQEFSDLVITQRGYQAASQIISSANDMLQELFSMKGK